MLASNDEVSEVIRRREQHAFYSQGGSAKYCGKGVEGVGVGARRWYYCDCVPTFGSPVSAESL
jgi:hypothetical protein